MFCLNASGGSTCIVVGLFDNGAVLRDEVLHLSSSVRHFRFPCGRSCNGKLSTAFYFMGSNKIGRRAIEVAGHLPSGALAVG